MSDEKHCFNCRYYNPFYTKGYKQFDKCDCGQCDNKNAVVDKHEGCEKFTHKFHARYSRKDLALLTVTEYVNVLAEIKQILEEDDEEDVKELFYDFLKRKNK